MDNISLRNAWVDSDRRENVRGKLFSVNFQKSCPAFCFHVVEQSRWLQAPGQSCQSWFPLGFPFVACLKYVITLDKVINERPLFVGIINSLKKWYQIINAESWRFICHWDTAPTTWKVSKSSPSSFNASATSVTRNSLAEAFLKRPKINVPE